MGICEPLKRGSVIKMPNGGQYIICEKVAEGGLSLVYTAKTKGNEYPVMIKEFFPAEYAHRAKKTEKDENGTIIVRRNRVYPDYDLFQDTFERALQAFEQEGKLGSAARMSNFQVLSFSDCGEGYAVMPRWSEDSCSFSRLVRGWRRKPPPSMDPYFSDLGRLRFALSAISSLLSLLAAIHEQGILHLDITSNNVVWAGKSTSPENGTTFLADFGCAVQMTGGKYPAKEVLSVSENYAAPECDPKLEWAELTTATDLYSVGQLLAFLCREDRVFNDSTTMEREMNQLNIPERQRKKLLAMLKKSTAVDMEDRYQSAAEMQSAVNDLLADIPLHPINADNRDAFTLYSLKSMLEGSQDTRYSWAQELCDRRKLSIGPFPDAIFEGLYGEKFQSDEAFLKAILPPLLYKNVCEKLNHCPDRQDALKSLLSCNYDNTWKQEFCGIIRTHPNSNELLKRCRTMLRNEAAYWSHKTALFQILGKDEERLKRCYRHCDSDIQNAPYVGLAMFTVYALLGPDGFHKLLPSPQDAQKLFHA